MKRLPNWRSRLADAVQASLESFKWGANDCAMFAARCIEAVIGMDCAADWRGTYSDMSGAVAALHAHGYDDLPSLIVGILGADAEIHPSQARRGDLALIQTGSILGWAVGIFDHERVGVMTLTGYGTTDRTDPRIVRAFRVGE
jgi:hypothetical protein